MSRLIDKTLLFALSVYILTYFTRGTDLLICVYISIIGAALNYYLLSRERLDFSMQPKGTMEWISFFLEIALVISTLFHPPLMAIIPLIMYDIAKSRNYVALTISIMVIISNFVYPISIYIIILSIMALVLNIKSERLAIYTKDIKKIRDDSTEKNARLRLQNTELMNARDTEVYNAQLSERNRIAREIHDNVGHTLSRAILQMGALLAIHKEEPIHSELESVRETLDNAMNNIRASVHDLHDDSIDVQSNIEQLAEPLKKKFNLEMDLDIGNNTPRPIKYAIIGITKECISNIMKHSTNTDVEIKLNEHPSMYQLIIHDFSYDKSDASNPHKKKSQPAKTKDISTKDNNDDFSNFGMGLENIRGRAESVNGTLNISTEYGFRVFVSIPK